MNVFVLSTGRCGSTSFVSACAQVRNYTAGHETRTAFLGDNRLAYPDRHIESDNRLAWLLGRLDRHYGDRAFYVHLTRDREATAASYNRRWHIPVGIVSAYAEAVLMGNRDRGLASCLDYVDTVNANIAAFLKDKTHWMPVRLEQVEQDFSAFWERIGAEGDLDQALAAWRVFHNTGTDLVPESVSGAQVRAAWQAAPDDPQRLRALVQFLVDSGALDEAADLLRGLLNERGASGSSPPLTQDIRETAASLAGDVLARVARRALDEGRHGTARQALEDLERLDRSRAFLPLAQEPASPAESQTGSGTGTEPDPAGSARLREAGDQAFQQGRATEAVDAYRRSLALDPDQPRVLNNLGIIESRRDWASALPYFDRAMRLDPDHPGIQGNLAIALAEAGRLKEASGLVTRRGSLVHYSVASNLMMRLARAPETLEIPEVAAGVGHLRRLAQVLGIELDRGRIAHSIFANYLHPMVPWREAALDRLSDAQMKEWVETRGIQGLRATLASGQGAVLVLSHLAAERVATLVLARMGFAINSLEFRNRLGDFGIGGADRVRIQALEGKEDFALREVYLARQALLRGEIFQLAGDGYQGGNQMTLGFLGRMRPFRGGFAELALAAAVPAFPVFCTLSPNGHLKLEVETPLNPGDPTLGHQIRVSNLVQGYAQRLERRWRQHPEDLVWDHLRRYFALSEVGAASPI